MRMLLIFLFICTACYHDNNDGWTTSSYLFRDFEEILKTNGKQLPKKEIIVIPNMGCPGCITSARMFFNENRNNNDYLFIFNEIDDMKMFKQILPKDNWEQRNVFVDSLDLLLKLEINSIYPLELREGRSGYLQQRVYKPKI